MTEQPKPECFHTPKASHGAVRPLVEKTLVLQASFLEAADIILSTNQAIPTAATRGARVCLSKVVKAWEKKSSHNPSPSAPFP